MHPNPAFRKETTDQNLAFARDRSFGALTINGPLIAHVPFVLNAEGTQADVHLVRSNPIARAELPAKAVICVNGPDGYISPDWYEVDDQVPTWNYVAVHLQGELAPLPAEALRDQIDRLSAQFEGRLDKAPWSSAKMTPAVLDKMMRQILPFRLTISEVTGTWKLNQNKPDDVRQRAAGLVETGVGSDLDALARLMARG